jgi:Cu+-exporting ATPase
MTRFAGAQTVLKSRFLEERFMSTIFDVEKMSCQNCAKHVTKAVQSVDPGAQVHVELATGKVTVTPSPADPAAIARAIGEAGYPAKVAG